jgi:hypothetical protein
LIDRRHKTAGIFLRIDVPIQQGKNDDQLFHKSDFNCDLNKFQNLVSDGGNGLGLVSVLKL